MDVPCFAIFATITGHMYVVWSGNAHERAEILDTLSDEWRAIIDAACLATGSGSLDEIADELDATCKGGRG